MPDSPHSVIIALTHFIDRYTRSHPELVSDADPNWRSPCEIDYSTDRKKVAWRPYKREPNNDLTGLERALECQMHHDIKAYYESFWSGDLIAEVPGLGHFNLLMPWNQEDMERLVANLIGHALQQKRRKRGLTWFFGCANDEDDYERFLSVDNASGKVLLETLTDTQNELLANNLSEFFRQIRPSYRVRMSANRSVYE